MNGGMNGRGRFIAVLLLLLAGAGMLVGAESVGDALGRVPWYDADADDWKRVVPRDRTQQEQIDGFGDVSLFAFAMYALIIAALALLLALIWKLRTPAALTPTVRRRATVQAGMAELPFPLETVDGDPEVGFRAACAAGDWRQAVIWLYAWQLLLLDSAGRLRLMVGKTNRAYLAEVADERTLAEALGATVAVFERAYFGREAVEGAQVRALEVQHRAVVDALRRSQGAR